MPAKGEDTVAPRDPAIRSTVLLTGGRIYRDAFDSDPTEAMLLCGGEIEWIGPAADAPATGRTIRLDGASVLPGLTDAHLHMIAVAQARLQISAADPPTSSLADYLDRLAAAARSTPAGAWTIGGDINEQLWPEKRLPDRHDLDAVVLNRPVLLRRFCGHVAILNTAGLNALGLSMGTDDPPAGSFDRREGALTGIAREKAAETVFTRVPRPSDEALIASLETVMNDLAGWGVTAAVEAAVGFTFGFEGEWRLWQSVRSARSLPLRLGFMAETDAAGAARAGLVPRADHRWQTKTLKFFADGIIGARTAALKGRYGDVPQSGFLIHEPDVLARLVGDAHRDGWQVAIHAIGDRAIDTVLAAYEEAQREQPRPDARHRIEHFGFPDAGALARAAACGAVVVTQPSFIPRMADSWVVALGDAADRLFPARSLLSAGVALAGSSDAPTGCLSPWEGIASFVARRAQTGRVNGPDETLTVGEALDAYTRGGAFAMGQETWRGRLEPGRAADIAVLDRDPFGCPPEVLGRISSRLTLVDGRPTYDRDRLWGDPV